MNSSRIHYIDLAKGLCMFVIVMGHSNYSINIKGITISIVPLFFVISGYFFSIKRDWKSFIKKKANTLLIPFLFFYILSYFFFYLIKYFKPSLLITDAEGILDLFNNRQFFNGPLWFLLDLFWCNIICYCIFKITNNQIIRLLLVCFTGFCGWYLGQAGYFWPLFFDVSLTSMPFFAFGFFLRKSNILNYGIGKRYCIIIGLVLYIISYCIEISLHQRLSLHYNIIEGWSTYLLSFTTVISVLFFCKAIQKTPFLNYFGRNSLIVLCVHHLIYRPLIVFTKPFPTIGLDGFTVAILTVILSTICIPIFSRLFPWFVAQKELIK